MSRKSVKWEDLDNHSRKIVRERIVPIYKWIEANKHKLPKGVVKVGLFAHVVPRQLGSPDLCNPKDPADLRHLSAMCWNYKTAGYLRRGPMEPGGPMEWRVNEECLPPGTVTYTGVSHTIDSPPIEHPPIVKQLPTEATAPAPSNEAAQAFLEQELKNIKVQSCRLGSGQHSSFYDMHADITFNDVTLYDVYKIGLAMEQSLGTNFLNQRSTTEAVDDSNIFDEDDIEDKDEDMCDNLDLCSESPF